MSVKKPVSINSYQHQYCCLNIRNAIAVRVVKKPQFTLYYLSLFDDEIEQRLELFLSVQTDDYWQQQSLAYAALSMEPTDAVVIIPNNQTFSIARGGVCNFPLYWSKNKQNNFLISTVLPIDESRTLSIPGLMASIAVVSVAYQNEPNLILESPLAGWTRCRRGAVSVFSTRSGFIAEYPVDFAISAANAPARQQLLDNLSSAMNSFGQKNSNIAHALLELSGGFDSTLAAIAAKRYGVDLQAISVHFPFYEFRYEEAIQKQVARELAVDRTQLQGSDFYAYADPDWWPQLDEPATSIIAIKRDLTMAKYAASKGIHRLLVGQGGDQLFSEDMSLAIPEPISLTRKAFNKTGWQLFTAQKQQMQSSKKYLQRSMLTYLHDARLDVVLKESFGTHTRSPFSDLAVVRCAMSWAALSSQLGVHEGKKILAEAFFEELPAVVVNRKSKVSWDGVCARTYAQHGDAIIEAIEYVSAPLAQSGFDVSWLVKRITQLSRWEKTSFGQDDREVFIAYALATWFRSWGIEKVADCHWKNTD